MILNNIKDSVGKTFKSETMWFGYALTILGVLEANMHLMEKNLGDNYGYAVAGIGVAIAILRMTTTKPLKDL